MTGQPAFLLRIPNDRRRKEFGDAQETTQQVTWATSQPAAVQHVQDQRESASAYISRAVCRCLVGRPLCAGIGTLLITFWNTAGVNSVWFPYFSPLCRCLHGSVHQAPSPIETRSSANSRPQMSRGQPVMWRRNDLLVSPVNQPCYLWRDAAYPSENESGWRLTHFPKDSFTFSQFTVTENPISEAPDV